MQAAIYCRVSAEDQEREGTSLQTQLDACLAYCQHKGYEVTRRFAETYSGLTLDRPRLRKLLDLIRTQDVIYCLDRLTRNPTHGVILTEELEKHHVALEAVTETVESTDLGKLISYIRGFASKLEAEKIRERTMRGQQAHLKAGKLPRSAGTGIYGYRWDKATGKRLVIDYEAKVVQRIFDTVRFRYHPLERSTSTGMRPSRLFPWVAAAPPKLPHTIVLRRKSAFFTHRLNIEAHCPDRH